MSAARERTAAIAGSVDRVLVIARILDTPRERVFRAWTDPDRLAGCLAPVSAKSEADGHFASIRKTIGA